MPETAFVFSLFLFFFAFGQVVGTPVRTESDSTHSRPTIHVLTLINSTGVIPANEALAFVSMYKAQNAA